MNLITKFPHFCQYLCLLTVNSCGVFEGGVFKKERNIIQTNNIHFLSKKTNNTF